MWIYDPKDFAGADEHRMFKEGLCIHGLRNRREGNGVTQRKEQMHANQNDEVSVAFLRLCETLGVPATAGAYLEASQLVAEVAAWRNRFPGYAYRRQDDCVTLK